MPCGRACITVSDNADRESHHGLDRTENYRNSAGRRNQQLRLRPEEIRRPAASSGGNVYALALVAFFL